MADWITTEEAAKISGYHPDHVRDCFEPERYRRESLGKSGSLIGRVCWPTLAL